MKNSNLFLNAAALLMVTGCDGGAVAPDAGADGRVTPHFALAADPMDFGAIPYPDDLYLDGDGRPSLGMLPGEAVAAPEDYPPASRAMLAELDGFGIVSPVFFFFDPGSISAESLPASAAASVRDDASAFLLDADTASPTAFERVPVSIRWDEARGLLAMRPYTGHPLVPGRRYAAVVTTDVRDSQGMPIAAHPRFAALRDATARPEDPLDAEAREHYDGVLANLESNVGLSRGDVAALAVFTTQTVAPELALARSTVWAGDAPAVRVVESYGAGAELDGLLGTPDEELPGLDQAGGVAHLRIGHLVQGRFDAPWFLSDVPRVHGRFRPDGEGGLEVGRTEEVPFTLTLPAGQLEDVPVVIFQHGLGSERSDLMGVADALAAVGYATLAIDIPYHGMRAAGEVVDVRHRFGTTEGTDDFGDRRGTEVQLDYFGVVDQDGELPAFHAVYVRDTVRQSVTDLMAMVRVVREGDWSAVTAIEGLESLRFSSESIGFVGVSLGGIIGTIFVGNEREIGAAVLNVTGGDWASLVEHSAAFRGTFLPLLLPRLGVDPVEVEDPAIDPLLYRPEAAILSTLVDRGDSIASAPLLASRPTHVLFQMAEHDETVGNIDTEALARASGAPILDASPSHTDFEQVDSPVSENVTLQDGTTVTRGMTVFSPATHGLLSYRSSSHNFEHPVVPPFTPRSAVEVNNPVDGAVGQLVFFFESWRSGAPRIEAPAP